MKARLSETPRVMTQVPFNIADALSGFHDPLRIINAGSVCLVGAPKARRGGRRHQEIYTTEY